MTWWPGFTELVEVSVGWMHGSARRRRVRALRLLPFPHRPVGLAQKRVGDVVAWVHFFGVLEIHRRALRIAPAQKDFAHLNEWSGAGYIERDGPG